MLERIFLIRCIIHFVDHVVISFEKGSAWLVCVFSIEHVAGENSCTCIRKQKVEQAYLWSLRTACTGLLLFPL